MWQWRRWRWEQQPSSPQCISGWHLVWDAARWNRVLGLIAETGEFHFLTEDEIQYFGTLSVSQTGVNGSFTGLAPLGFTFDDGSVRGTGTLTGTIQERVRMPS